MVRTQIFLTREEIKLLEAESKQARLTKSEIIRRAVDKYLGAGKVTKERLLQAFDESRGIFKAQALKKHIRKLRASW